MGNKLHFINKKKYAQLRNKERVKNKGDKGKREVIKIISAKRAYTSNDVKKAE
jgi:hypothetical protein